MGSKRLSSSIRDNDSAFEIALEWNQSPNILTETFTFFY